MKDDTSSTVVDNLIDVRGRKFFLGTSFIQIPKVDTNSNGSLIFIDKDNV